MNVIREAPELSTLQASPLDELKSRSIVRNICDAEGNRLPGAPWGFQLAAVLPDGSPSVRTIGFNKVASDGFTFLTKRPAADATLDGRTVAICYVEGKYQPGDVCEQWRAEGVAEMVNVEEILDTAPLGSFAQILASSENWRHPMEEASAGTFLEQVAAKKEALTSGRVPLDDIRASVAVYKVNPVRVEINVGGASFPMWNRFEWTRSPQSPEWQKARRLSPY